VSLTTVALGFAGAGVLVVLAADSWRTALLAVLVVGAIALTGARFAAVAAAAGAAILVVLALSGLTAAQDTRSPSPISSPAAPHHHGRPQTHHLSGGARSRH
jgi:CBS-domain-containing membrane protein